MYIDLLLLHDDDDDDCDDFFFARDFSISVIMISIMINDPC